MQNLMIIEDDHYMNETLEMIFLLEGYNVISYKNGTEALTDLSDKEKIDLVILDYNLRNNNLSGIDIYEKLKTSNPKLKVIMISAYGNNKLKEEARKKGIMKFFDKPFQIDELVVTAKQLIN